MEQKTKLPLVLLVLLHVVEESTSLPATFEPSTIVVAPHTYHQQKLQREHDGTDYSEPGQGTTSQKAPESEPKKPDTPHGYAATGTRGTQNGAPEGVTNMKTGYSKVTRQSATLGDEEANVIALDPATAKSLDIIKEMEQLYEDEDDEDDAETLSSDGTSSYSEISASLSAKDSLAIFMRRHLHAPGGTGSEEPIAEKLTLEAGSSDTAAAPPMKEEELSSIMKSRLSDFVKKYMGGLLKAEIQEVRVEQRANGLREYNGS